MVSSVKQHVAAAAAVEVPQVPATQVPFLSDEERAAYAKSIGFTKVGGQAGGWRPKNGRAGSQQELHLLSQGRLAGAGGRPEAGGRAHLTNVHRPAALRAACRWASTCQMR